MPLEEKLDPDELRRRNQQSQAERDREKRDNPNAD